MLVSQNLFFYQISLLKYHYRTKPKKSQGKFPTFYAQLLILFSIFPRIRTKQNKKILFYISHFFAEENFPFFSLLVWPFWSFIHPTPIINRQHQQVKSKVKWESEKKIDKRKTFEKKMLLIKLSENPLSVLPVKKR